MFEVCSFYFSEFFDPLRSCYAVVIILRIANYRCRVGESDLAVQLSHKERWQRPGPNRVRPAEVNRRAAQDTDEEVKWGLSYFYNNRLLHLPLMPALSLSLLYLTHKLSKVHVQTHTHIHTQMYNRVIHCYSVLHFTFYLFLRHLVTREIKALVCYRSYSVTYAVFPFCIYNKLVQQDFPEQNTSCFGATSTATAEKARKSGTPMPSAYAVDQHMD